jgi:hypothetical protein
MFPSLMTRESVMRGQRLLQVITGQPVDDVDALTAELEAEKAKASEACSQLDWLERERKTADSFEAARALDEQIAEAKWVIAKADERIPHLEGRLKAARAERQAEALARHQTILRRRYPQFRKALQQAVEQQAEVIREREAAVLELGKHLAQIHLPHITYAGFLFKDLLAIWTGENDRVFSDPLPKPAVVPPRPAPAPAKPDYARHGFGWTEVGGGKPVQEPEPPPPRVKRVPRHDAPPADGTQRQVAILRTGLELPDGTQSVAGDIITVPAEHATLMVKTGAAEFAASVETKNDDR